MSLPKDGDVDASAACRYCGSCGGATLVSTSPRIATCDNCGAMVGFDRIVYPSGPAPACQSGCPEERCLFPNYCEQRRN